MFTQEWDLRSPRDFLTICTNSDTGATGCQLQIGLTLVLPEKVNKYIFESGSLHFVKKLMGIPVLVAKEAVKM